MSDNNLMVDRIGRGWELLGAGEFDALAALYSEDMVMVIPGQNDVISGNAAFRAALDGIGDVLPPGFDITGMRYCVGDKEVVNIVEWKSTNIPDGTQSTILFKFDENDLITQERWFVDTEQWKNAF